MCIQSSNDSLILCMCIQSSNDSLILCMYMCVHKEKKQDVDFSLQEMFLRQEIQSSLILCMYMCVYKDNTG